MGTRDEGEGGERSLPKAMRHKRVLDVAAERPDASIETIAEEIPSATTDLVEHVLEEYGDPATKAAELEDGDVEAAELEDGDVEAAELEDGDGATPGDGDALDGGNEAAGFEKWTSATDEEDGPLDPSELTDKQREVLRAIRERPRATQREIAERLDVSAATVSNRVNAIDGFEWEDRRAIAEAVFDSSSTEPQRETTDMTPNESEPQVSTDQLHDRVATIERRIDELTADADSVLDDPELAHKVLRACFESDTVTEEEELRLLEGLLR